MTEILGPSRSVPFAHRTEMKVRAVSLLLENERKGKDFRVWKIY